MNLSLSSKIRLLDRRKLFYEEASQPCWYAVFSANEKRKQSKWKIGVKYNGEKEENTFSLSALDLDDNAVWESIRTVEFASKLLESFRTGGKKAVKELLKDETIE